MLMSKKIVQSSVLAMTLLGFSPLYAAEQTNNAPASTAQSAPSVEALVNVNTASAEQLMAVKGIGEKRANAIVEYRNQHGNFKSVDDLINVKGISEKSLKNIQNQLTIG